MSGLTTYKTDIKESRTANMGLAKGGLTCFVETFVPGLTFVLRMNFSAKNPALRQAQNRYASPCDSPLIGGQLTFWATLFQICFNSSASLPTHILAHLQAHKAGHKPNLQKS